MGRGTGYGKTILIGDSFVLREVPAIVSAIPFETVATVERIEGEGWTLDDQRMEVPGYKAKKREQQVASINRILEVMHIDVSRTPIRIHLGGTLLAGSGVGASAASCVSLARALNEEFELGLSIEEINQVAWEGEFAYHGVPSGVDNTASCYGGIMLYRIRAGKKMFERIPVKAPFEIVLANSGVTANTIELDARVQKAEQRDPAWFGAALKTVEAQALDMRKRLETGDLEGVGEIMTANHRILIDMGLSHEILIHLCNLALEQGALGAKLTGGGMGGYMVALTPGRELQEKVASAMEAEGYAVIKAVLGSY